MGNFVPLPWRCVIHLNTDPEDGNLTSVLQLCQRYRGCWRVDAPPRMVRDADMVPRRRSRPHRHIVMFVSLAATLLPRFLTNDYHVGLLFVCVFLLCGGAGKDRARACPQEGGGGDPRLRGSRSVGRRLGLGGSLPGGAQGTGDFAAAGVGYATRFVRDSDRRH